MSMPAPKARDGGGEDDLAVLYPERQATIAGTNITMREYGFVEGLRLASRVQHIVDALADLAADGDSLTPTVLRPVFARHLDDVFALIAVACDQPEEWVRGLGDADGQALMLLWWVTNADFFVRRVIEAVTVRQLQAAPGGPTSLPASSPQATTAPDSASIRVVN